MLEARDERQDLRNQYYAGFNFQELLRSAQGDNNHKMTFRVSPTRGEGACGSAAWRDSCVLAKNTEKSELLTSVHLHFLQQRMISGLKSIEQTLMDGKASPAWRGCVSIRG